MDRGTFERNAAVIRWAVSEEVLDASLEPFVYAPTDMMRWIEAHRSKDTKVPFVNVDQNAQSLRSIIHTFGKTPEFDITEDNIIELAQVAIPEGNVGYLTNLEQYVADKDGNYYATAAQNWGNPYNETVLTDQIVWHFQVQKYYGAMPARFDVSAVGIANYQRLLPGRAWSELPSITGLWYPASKENVFCATIPPGHILRLFAYVPSTCLQVYSWRIAGKMHAKIQSALCSEAWLNTRTLT